MNTTLKLSALSLIAIISVTACSQKPSTEEVAAQVKIELEKEKSQQTAQSAEVASEVAAQVKEVLAEEKSHKTPSAREAAKQEVERKHEAAQSLAQQSPTMQPAAGPTAAHPASYACGNCGVVLAVNKVEEQGKGSALGVIGGGVVGGLLGNQVGNGTGRDVATIAGAIGGAFAGNAIEKNAKKTYHYEIAVRMDDGAERTYRQANDPGLAGGTKVKIENDTVIRN